MKTPKSKMTMKIVKTEMTDNELDTLLSLASMPPPSKSAHAAVMARIDAGQTAGNVVHFPVAAKKPSAIRWLAALPLAASLAAGIWLGAAGQGTDYLFNTSDELASVSDSFATSTGIDDAEILTEEGLT
jgi:hypothetical protein